MGTRQKEVIFVLGTNTTFLGSGKTYYSIGISRILNLMMCVCFLAQTDASVNISWNITSMPVEFGETAVFACQVDDAEQHCSRRLLQWIGGPRYISLCQNMTCMNHKKYYVYSTSPCLYVLKIFNFSMDDVNCYYSCLYGASSQKKHLQLNSRDFQYIPKRNDIFPNITVQHNLLKLKVLIQKTYPLPVCYTMFMEKNMTNDTEVRTTEQDHFFAIEVLLNCFMPVCGGKLNVSCTIGKEVITIVNEEVNKCTYIKPETERSALVPAVCVIVTILSIVLVMMIAVFCRKCLRKSQNFVYILLQNSKS